ncbi:MAG TPA: secretin N-terminal domain-containing protein [Pyrinomonadaceae bacterium]|jgi:general secretion pathway protein D|nr:secretin N-terminal domain-containing protein [Pyrinomonadaceae bacterium]
MKTSIRARSFAALLVTFCLLMTPITALAKKGEKNFKQGMKYEAAQQWDRAAQEFSLAVAADPANMEYQLHYRRALFNASQMYMIQGRSLAEQRDYIGAYNAFRQAYGYDQVNQLALSEMDRMLRLQNEKEGIPPGSNGLSAPEESKVAPTSYQAGSNAGTLSRGVAAQPQQEPVATLPPRVEQLRVINYSGDLKSFIRSLAEQLSLNVIFDSQSFRQPRNIEINLRDVTTAQALDYIFLQEGLFFQKLSRRTIVVADQTRRPQYQQLVIRTFYLANVDPNETKTLIQQAIPPQQGRPQTIVIADKATNSLTVRDTAENVRLIGDIISSIDKDRAEVVMDVNIYEVSREDLLQFGNQLGDSTTLTNLGGLQRGLSAFLGDRATAFTGVPTAAGAALVIPASTISALQRKDRTKLIASTQVHAFNGEESTARIGQRVPVQTAQTFPFGTTSTTGGTTGGVNTGVGFAGGFPVFNYEPTGLTLKFTPQVFPNLDVQVKMSIESKDVVNIGSPTPTFTERTITGTARIQNNRTMMLASVAQDKQSEGRAGFPLLGLIPILGRLFSTPRRNNFQTDVVIAVTPRVLRAPAVTPRDEEQRPSGTLQTPTTGSLEALLQDADREERQAVAAAAAARDAAARRAQMNVTVQLPDAEPAYVPAPRALAGAAASGGAVAAASNTAAPNNAAMSSAATTATATSAPPSLVPVNIPPATTAASGGPSAVAANLSNTAAPSATASAPAPVIQSLALPGNVDVAEKLRAMLAQPSASPTMTTAAAAAGGSAQVETALAALDAPPSPLEKSAATAAAATSSTTTATTTAATSTTATSTATTAAPPPPVVEQQPAAASTKTEAAVKTPPATTTTAATVAATAELRLLSERQEMRVGEKQRLALLLTTNAPLGTALLALRFDPRTIALRDVTKGLASVQGAVPSIMQSVDPNGMLLISVSPSSPDTPLAAGSYVLLYLDIEALAPGESRIVFDQTNMYLHASDGRGVQLGVVPGRFLVKQ